MRKFLVALLLVLAGFQVYRAGVRAGTSAADSKVVMMAEVYSCHHYSGAFLVTGSGVWMYFTDKQLTESEADILALKMPPGKAARLSGSDGYKGDCPFSLKT